MTDIGNASYVGAKNMLSYCESQAPNLFFVTGKENPTSQKTASISLAGINILCITLRNNSITTKKTVVQRIKIPT